MLNAQIRKKACNRTNIIDPWGPREKKLMAASIENATTKSANKTAQIHSCEEQKQIHSTSKQIYHDSNQNKNYNKKI